MFIISFVLSLSVSLFSQNTYGGHQENLIEDELRKDLKQMTLQNHIQKHSYKKARKYIMQVVHLEQDNVGFFVKDVYCNIEYRKKIGPSFMPSHTKINIEHTWPRSRMGENKKGPKYKQMEADLHHLYPTNSKANSVRGNHIFSSFKDFDYLDIFRAFELYNCSSSKKSYNDVAGKEAFEPPNEHKGNVARALFYIAVRYDLEISEHEEAFLREWNKFDPVDEAEMARNNAIELIQGNRNPFIDDAEHADFIENF